MKINKNILNEMLTIAELASSGHKERRQLEFRISISYITLLALALYQLIKFSPEENDLSVPLWIIVTVCVLLLTLHWKYCEWLYAIHVASNNDVRRRDFYLKKVEIIAYYMSKSSDSDFAPSNTNTITINLGAGDSRELSERELFDQSEPDIYIRSKNQGTPTPKWYKNVHFLFPAFFATLMAVSLIGTLILKTGLGYAIKSILLLRVLLPFVVWIFSK